MNKKSAKHSIVRTKKSAISLADIILESGADLLPGGGIGYKAIKVLARHAVEWKKEQVEQRMEDFHQKILAGISLESQKELLEKEFLLEDYYALLSHVTNDEEEQKVEIYATIFKSLLTGTISQDIKKHLIKSIRELDCSDFEFMRKLYINNKYEFRNPGNKNRQIQTLTGSRDPIICSSVQKLVRLGFLYEKDGTKPAWPTDFLKSIVELIYMEENLTAESVDQEAKTFETERLKVFFACKDIGASGQFFAKITEVLFSNKIKCVVANPIRKSIPLILSPIIAVCIGPNGSPEEDIIRHVNTNKKHLIQIYLPGSDKRQHPSTRRQVFDFTEQNFDSEIEKLIAFINNLFKD